MTFTELQLKDSLLRAVHAAGYETPTPIQQRAIPHVLQGKDLLGIAQTGTGKTAAFALPILQRLAAPEAARAAGYRPIRCLILAPTRELAAQIGESFDTYGRHTGLTNAVIFGGVGQAPQTRALKAGLDVLIATPGRLLDLMEQGFVDLRKLEIFVLDEADRMLDMGFIHDVRKVIARLPPVRQTLLFSATMPGEIVELSRTLLRDPVRVEVTPAATTAERVGQKVMFVEKADKKRLLEDILRRPDVTRALVFTRTKHGANRLVEQLGRGGITAMAIHGNKSQGARERALSGFKDGHLRVLVATDIAARGIDIDEISHVINYELPNVPEQYVHRIGRTARAGAAGEALSLIDREERAYLRDIERLIRATIPAEDHPYSVDFASEPIAPPPAEHFGRGARPQGQRQHHNGGRNVQPEGGAVRGRPHRRRGRGPSRPR